MNLDNTSFVKFTRVSGIDVRFVDSVRKLDPMHTLSGRSLDHPVVGRYDTDTNTILIHVRPTDDINESVIRDNINKLCLYTAIKEFGIAGLFEGRLGPNEKGRLETKLKEVGFPSLAAAVSDDSAMNRRYIQKTIYDNFYASGCMSSLIGDIMGLPIGWKGAKMVTSAQEAHTKKCLDAAVAMRDFQAVEEDCRAQMAVKTKNKYIPVGYASEPYIMADYPKIPIVLNKMKMQTHAGQEDYPEGFIKGIHDPLAIIKDETNDGKTSYVIVTSSVLRNGEYLCLRTEEPEKIAANYDVKPDTKVIFTTPFHMPADTVVNLLQYSEQNDDKKVESSKHLNKIIYLKETKTQLGETIYDIFESLDSARNKGEARNSPSLYGLRSSLLKSLAANIGRNFENPKNSEEYFQLFNKTRDSLRDAREERAKKADLKATSGEAVEPTPTKDEWALSYALPPSLIPESQWRKLEKKGLTSTTAIKEAGEDAVKALIGNRNAERLFLYARTRRKAVSEQAFSQLTPEQKDREIRKDLDTALKLIPLEVKTMPIYIPIGKDGTAFDGEAGAVLLAKSISMGRRWNRCPVFFTKEELAQYGFMPLSTCEGTNILHQGEYKTVYNIYETTMSSQSTDVYESYISALKDDGARQASKYIRIILDSLRSPDVIYENSPLSALGTYMDRELKRNDVRKTLSFREAIGKELHDALVQDAKAGKVYTERGLSEQKPEEAAGEVSELTGEIIHEKKTTVRKDDDKFVSLRDTMLSWFAKLPYEKKSNVLGYINEVDMFKNYFPKTNVPEIDGRIKALLTHSMDAEFARMKPYNMSLVKQKADYLDYISDNLKPGQYDISAATIGQVAFSINMMHVSDDGAVSFLAVPPGDTMFRQVRHTAVNIKQLDKICDVLNVKPMEFHIASGNGISASEEEYKLATEMAMFMADKLNEHGIKTVVVSDEKARRVLEQEHALSSQGRSSVEFSMRDIMNLSYTWNGEEVSMRGFAEQFMSEIKQKDRTMEDAERIAKTFIEAVKADPEKAGMKMLKAEYMANAFRFKLPDGTVYTPEHPMAESPEYETQKVLWEIYEHVLGKETMREFIGLLSKNAPMSSEERRRYSELESRVNGSDVMQRSLEIPASKVNENRVKDIRNLIQYFEGNDDYTWTEKALIVKGAMSFGYSEKKDADSTMVEIKNISDNNSVSVPVIGGEAAAVVEGLRKGLNFKDALVQARIMLSKEIKRSVGGNFTGWKVYKKSDKEEDAVILNQDVAGTGWCTGSAVSTARSHLSGGDFHVYYEAGEPLIAIRTNNGRMAEPPRGAHEDQFCKPREEQIAFDYIRSGNGVIAGGDYIADIEDIRRVMSPNATPLDAFMMPENRRYENGEFGDTKAWGTSVEQRIAELVPDKKEERWKLGLYYGNEIEYACKNANAIAIKGYIELYGSASLTLSEGVTQVGNIYLYDSTSLTLPEGVTQVGKITLSGSASLTLPEGVTQVGEIVLSGSTSLTLPAGVTQVGNISLYDSASLTLPEGVTQVGNISLHGSASLTLPEGVTQVGNIYFYDSTSLTLPEGVTQVGDIYLYENASLTLPEGVTQVGNISLYDSASLTLPEGVTRVGDISLSDSCSFSIPESLNVTGTVRLYGSSSIIFPDGYVLRNEGKGAMHYSSDFINGLLSKHQKKQEFRLSDGTVYGYQQGDTIYLTPAGINPNTPIHEYAHLWAEVIQRLEPEKWESLKVELKKNPMWDAIKGSHDYSFLQEDEDRLAGEVLATLIGNKGEQLQVGVAKEVLSEGVNEKDRLSTAVARFREKINEMVTKDVFGIDGRDVTGEITLKVLKDFAEGRGVKLEPQEASRLAAMAGDASIKEKFLADLNRFNEGKMLSHEHFNLGQPCPLLVALGLPNEPVRLNQSILKKHIEKHNLSKESVEGLYEALRHPIMIYRWGTTSPSTTIISETEQNGRKLTFGIQVTTIDGKIQVNDIRSIHGKEADRLIKDINSPVIDFAKDDLLWVNKEKVLSWFTGMEALLSSVVTQQELDYATKVIKNFDNSKYIQNETSFSLTSQNSKQQNNKTENAMAYTPSPVDTSSVGLTRIEKNMVESIAALAHENWRQQRLAEGLTEKDNPLLKPWGKLTPEQRASSLDQAEQTMKVAKMSFINQADTSVKVAKATFDIKNFDDYKKIDRDTLVDAVAKNAHEVWAQQRMADGWTYGKVRDNNAKKHPMLIPYEDLPESEKAYDKLFGEVAFNVITDFIEGKGISRLQANETVREVISDEGVSRVVDISNPEISDDKIIFVRFDDASAYVIINDKKCFECFNNDQVTSIPVLEKSLIGLKLSYMAPDAPGLLPSDQTYYLPDVYLKKDIFQAVYEGYANTLINQSSSSEKPFYDDLVEEAHAAIKSLKERYSDGTLLSPGMVTESFLHKHLPTLSQERAEIMSKEFARLADVANNKKEEILDFNIYAYSNNIMGMSPKEAGVSELINLYKDCLITKGLEPMTVVNAVETLKTHAGHCAHAFIVNDDTPSLHEQLLIAAATMKVTEDPSTILLRRNDEISIREISNWSLENGILTYDLEYKKGAPIIRIAEDNSEVRQVIIRGEKAGIYNYAHSGMLLCALRDGFKIASPIHAIHEMTNDLQDILGNMNSIQLIGLSDLMESFRKPISYFKRYVNDADTTIDKSSMYRIEEYSDVLNKAIADVTKQCEQAKSETISFMKRGCRTNNTIIDRLLGRTFNPTHPLPPVEQLNPDTLTYRVDPDAEFKKMCTSEGSFGTLSILYDGIPIESAAIHMREVVESLEVMPIGDLAYELKKANINIISPHHNVNDDYYVAASTIERKLEEHFGKGANDSDQVCTIEFYGYQALLIEHAGVYTISDNILDVMTGELHTVSAPGAEHQKKLIPTVIEESEIHEIPQNFARQLELSGRINGTISAADGDLLVVQKDGNSLISLRAEDVAGALQDTVSIEGKEYRLDARTKSGLSYGVGQWLKADDGERVYGVFDVKEQKVVKATPFEDLNREYCVSRAAKAKKDKEQEKAQDQTKTVKKGRGGR